MGSMKVLIVAESFLPRSNGVTNSVTRSMRYLRENGHEVLVLAPGDGPIEVEGQQVVRVPALSFSTLATIDISAVTVNRIRKIMTRFEPDIVHLASPFILGEQARKAAKSLDIPTIAVFQTDISGFASFYGLTIAKTFGDLRMQKIHSKVDLNLVPSSESRKYLEELGISNIRHWARGVDHQQFNSKHRSRSIRKSWGADSNTCVIGYVGRIAPEKQIENLKHLRDIAILAGKQVEIVVIGDGPSREKMQSVLPSAHFLGQLHGTDLATAFASLDILVSTGEHETFCQVIQEAMAASLPVIAPRAGGPIDLVQHGVTGFLYQPGSARELRKFALALVARPELRLSMGVAAYQTVKSRTWSSVCSQLLEYYTEAVNRNRQSKVS